MHVSKLMVHNPAVSYLKVNTPKASDTVEDSHGHDSGPEAFLYNSANLALYGTKAITPQSGCLTGQYITEKVMLVCNKKWGGKQCRVR